MIELIEENSIGTDNYLGTTPSSTIATNKQGAIAEYFTALAILMVLEGNLRKIGSNGRYVRAASDHDARSVEVGEFFTKLLPFFEPLLVRVMPAAALGIITHQLGPLTKIFKGHCNIEILAVKAVLAVWYNEHLDSKKQKTADSYGD